MGVWKLRGLREPRGEGATLFLLSCQETQRWREKFLGKKGLQVNDAVASKKLVWLPIESFRSAASRRSDLSEGTAQNNQQDNRRYCDNCNYQQISASGLVIYLASGYVSKNCALQKN
jgi:hypothetical protein